MKMRFADAWQGPPERSDQGSLRGTPLNEWVNGAQRQKGYSKTFPNIFSSFFTAPPPLNHEERRLQYERCGELASRALLAPDCCQSPVYDVYVLEGQFVAQVRSKIQ